MQVNSRTLYFICNKFDLVLNESGPRKLVGDRIMDFNENMISLYNGS